MKQSLMTGAATTPFAHLLGSIGLTGRKARGARAEDETPKDEKDDDAKKGARSEDPEDDEDKKDARRAEESDDEDDKKDDAKKGGRADESDDDEDKKDGKKKSKAKADDEDETCAEEDDDDDEVAAAARAGRKAERARCRKIFSTQAAGLRPDVAAQLAFTTNLSSAEAIGVLEAAAAGKGVEVRATSRIHERMARVAQPAVGQDVEDGDRKPDAPSAKAAAIVASMNKAQGRKA